MCYDFYIYKGYVYTSAALLYCYGITPNALDVKFLGRFSDWESADSFFQSSKAKKS